MTKPRNAMLLLVGAATLMLVGPCVAQEVVYRINAAWSTPCDGCAAKIEALGNLRNGEDLGRTAGCGRADMGQQRASAAATGANSFVVYRVDQVDSLVVPLQNQVNLLQKNILMLATANDVLTKRLNEIDAKSTSKVRLTKNQRRVPVVRQASLHILAFNKSPDVKAMKH